MKPNCAEIRVRGKTITVPSTEIDDRTVIVTGRWLKMSAIKDEELVEGDVVANPESFLERLTNSNLKSDIFTFAQELTETKPKYKYHLEWDSAAVIPITTFTDWWTMRAEYDVRKAVRRATKAGVVVRPVEFNDEFVRGIVDIYNESPTRQGRPFWHYGKDFDTVKAESATYLDRSDFIGAYYQGELIGFIKMVYVGKTARTLHVISKQRYHDKKPTNALIAKAVEICANNRVSYLKYGDYIYNNQNSSFTEFKRRSGFEELLVPRYYVPLTFKGRIAIRLNLHLGIKPLLPHKAVSLLLNARSEFYKAIAFLREVARKSDSHEKIEC